MSIQLMNLSGGTDPDQLGKTGEALVLHWLLARGYALMATRYRRLGFELDLIVERDGYLIGVEVKTWQEAEHFLTKRQVKRLERGLRTFAYQNRLTTLDLRLIAVFVSFGDEGIPIFEEYVVGE